MPRAHPPADRAAQLQVLHGRAWLVFDGDSRVWRLPAITCPRCDGDTWEKWRFWGDVAPVQHELHRCVECGFTLDEVYITELLEPKD